MQKFICIGRITKDIELTKTNNGLSVTKFTIAVNKRFKSENEENTADFFNCVAWRVLAENIAKFCHKGSKVCIVGELQNKSWEANDGTKKYATEIIVNECEFLDAKQDDKKEKKIGKETEALQPIDDDTLPF